MKLTVQIQLLPDKEQTAQLRETIERFNLACNWLAQEAFARKTSNFILLQKLYYAELRQRFGLSSQMAAICIRHVAAAYKRDKAKLPRWRKRAAILLIVAYSVSKGLTGYRSRLSRVASLCL